MVWVVAVVSSRGEGQCPLPCHMPSFVFFFFLLCSVSEWCWSRDPLILSSYSPTGCWVFTDVAWLMRRRLNFCGWVATSTELCWTLGVGSTQNCLNDGVVLPRALRMLSDLVIPLTWQISKLSWHLQGLLWFMTPMG